VNWKGNATITGACLITKININFLHELCSNLINASQITVKVTLVLKQSELIDRNADYVQRLTYLTLKLEKTFTSLIKYVDSLALCSNEHLDELWINYNTITLHLDTIWQKFKAWKTSKQRTSFPTSTWETQVPVIITTIEASRPSNTQQGSRPQSFLGIIAGLGVAFGVGAITSAIPSLFGGSNNNVNDIKTLNNNIQKLSKQILITNNRIDVLAENVTNAINDVKVILNKIVAVSERAETLNTLLWNIDQIIDSYSELFQSFRIGKLIVTLLESGIITPDLIDIYTFNKIIHEGLSAFPDLTFPINITKYTLPDVIKILHIEKVSHNNFLMMIPLTHKEVYQIYNVIPHPINIETKALVIAELNNVILVNNHSYIITSVDNIHSFNKEENHIIKDIVPIYNLHHPTCEWVSFTKNLSAMINLCNYKKVGGTTEIHMSETPYYRLIHLPNLTQVELDCPEGKIRDSLEGLHKIPLECDIRTENVFWPARQTLKIDIINLLTQIPQPFDATKLPVININQTTQIHSSIKALITKLPGEDDSFTFNFEKYDLSLEEVQSYTIIAYGTLSILVILNSIFIGLMIIMKCKRWLTNKSNKHDSEFPPRNSFTGLRDSLKKRTEGLRDSLKARTVGVRDSFRINKDKFRSSLSSKFPHSPSLTTLRDNLRRESTTPINSANIGTNTEPLPIEMSSNNLDITPSKKQPSYIYPTIPRY